MTEPKIPQQEKEINNDQEFTHIDLFSGIGGFTLAGEWAGFKTVVFCEKDEFCQKILKKHWPEIPIIPEIRDFCGADWEMATLITGGFPCQPFSVAGRKRGKEDDRYLWPEMLRVISEGRPRWVLAENVYGIVRMALSTVLSDLENEGYATEVLTIPACAVNAPHRRDRIWIVGYLQPSDIADTQKQRNSNRVQKIPRSESASKRRKRMGDKHINSDCYASDSKCLGRQKRAGGKAEYEKQIPKGQNIGNSCTKRYTWQKNWYEIATRFCRMDDGISDRVYRLKALGNAIVPQVAYEILKNIVRIERGLHV